MVRQALRILLQAEPDFEVVGEAANLAQSVERVKDLAPDILLLDAATARFAGGDLWGQIHVASPLTRVIALLGGGEKLPRPARRRLAGVVLKTSSYETLATAVRAVAAGKRYFPADSNGAAQRRARPGRKSERVLQAGPELTAREEEVLQLVARGFTSREIGLRLGISRRTVEVHRSKLMKKLALRDRAELARFVFCSAPFARQDLEEKLNADPAVEEENGRGERI